MVKDKNAMSLVFALLVSGITSCTMQPTSETSARHPGDQMKNLDNGKNQSGVSSSDSKKSSTSIDNKTILNFSVKILATNPIIIGNRSEINVEFTNLSNETLSINRECLNSLEISNNSSNEIIIPIDNISSCVAILLPPVVLKPQSSHLFRVGFWDGLYINGKAVSPGEYKIKGKLKLSYQGETRILDAVPLVIKAN